LYRLAAPCCAARGTLNAVSATYRCGQVRRLVNPSWFCACASRLPTPSFVRSGLGVAIGLHTAQLLHDAQRLTDRKEIVPGPTCGLQAKLLPVPEPAQCLAIPREYLHLPEVLTPQRYSGPAAADRRERLPADRRRLGVLAVVQELTIQHRQEKVGKMVVIRIPDQSLLRVVVGLAHGWVSLRAIRQLESPKHYVLALLKEHQRLGRHVQLGWA